MDIIPFFYYDVVARIGSGAVVLGLLRLASIPWPTAWMQWFPSGDSVVVPFVYVGLAYLIGLLLDVVLSEVLASVYLGTFQDVLCQYTWFDSRQTTTSPPWSQGWRSKHLARWAWDIYLLRTAEHLSAEQPHALRFHAEAKLFLHASAATMLLVAASTTSRFCELPRLVELDWPAIAVLFLGMLTFAVSLQMRARRRWEQVFLFLDHFGSTRQDDRLHDLVRRIQQAKVDACPQDGTGARPPSHPMG